MNEEQYKEHWGHTPFVCNGCRHTYSMITAKWVYNDTIKKKVYACPKCKCRVMIHLSEKEMLL